jgi:hypothetical protein
LEVPSVLPDPDAASQGLWALQCQFHHTVSRFCFQHRSDGTAPGAVNKLALSTHTRGEEKATAMLFSQVKQATQFEPATLP